MMIAKRDIQKDLKRLEGLYSASILAPDISTAIYFSKLGVLELTGWVEESFDTIARRAAKSRFKKTKFENLVKEAIKGNYGFSYDRNFLTMMAKIIGLPECEQLEQYLDSDGRLNILKSELDAVLQQRRKAAHVNLAQTTIAFDSPSVSLGRLGLIHPIIKDIYHWFCSRPFSRYRTR